ncbi:MAG: arginine--tRNA ligase [Gammaproteobacteria bacterium]|nr:MAG: arginine--tRNA ligase [Gammaproteobacteria bacterium]
MNIIQLLEDKIHEAMIGAGIPASLPARVTAGTKAEFGDFQANGALAAAKQLKQKPRDLANEIVAQLKLEGIADHIDIAGPGFINIHLANSFLADATTELYKLTSGHNERGCPVADKTATIVIDYSSPNLAKEMHVGHLRSTIIGDAMARVLECMGHRVIRQNHMGDWGTQFGMLIAELEEQVGEGELPELALQNLENFYQQAKAHFDADAGFADKARNYVVKLQSGDQHCQALWQQFIDISIAHSEEIYQQLNVTLNSDHIRPESAYNSELPCIVNSLKDLGLAKEDQGAIVVFLDELADKKGQPSPVIVQKSDGGYLYATSDLAALRYRSEQLKADRALYFIDARQGLHMKQIFAVARNAGFVENKMQLEHLAFGTMMGEDGKPFKTRSGGTVKLAQLLDEAIAKATVVIEDKNPDLSRQEQAEVARKVGIGAIKYADLSKTRTNDYLFNWDNMLSFEGNTAPYLQYAYARIRSIFRRTEIDSDKIPGQVVITNKAEKALALQLLDFDNVITQMAKDGFPHTLCNYLHELASSYMTFYEQCPILKEEVDAPLRNSRLQFCELTAKTLQKGLHLLGIETMERM